MTSIAAAATEIAIYRKPIDLAGIGIAIFLSLVVLLPLLVVVIWAFTEVWRYPSILPQQWGVKYWALTLGRNDVWVALTTSLLLATTVTAISTVVCLPAAYAFARLRFPGRNIFFLSFLTVHAFPKFGLYVTIATILSLIHI